MYVYIICYFDYYAHIMDDWVALSLQGPPGPQGPKGDNGTKGDEVSCASGQ